jgi:hypothetical protein
MFIVLTDLAILAIPDIKPKPANAVTPWRAHGQVKKKEIQFLKKCIVILTVLIKSVN